MPIDASIYGNLRNIAIPNYEDVKKEQALGQIAQQKAKAGQAQMHEQKIATLGQTLEGLASMSPEQRKQAYPMARKDLIASGVMSEKDAPPELDDSFFNHYLGQFRASQDYKLKQAELNKIRAQSSKDKGPKKLSSQRVLQLNEGAAIPTTLVDIKGTIDKNKSIFGPIAGRAASYNPYSEKAQTIDAQVRAASQQFGRYMEGGVLRKEDEEKYRKMFPNLTDTPEVAANKLKIVDRLLKKKYTSDVLAIKKSGYDVSGLANIGAIPDVPDVVSEGEKKKEGMPSNFGLGDTAIAQEAPSAPESGTVEGGYRFKGGDPSNQANWEKVE